MKAGRGPRVLAGDKTLGSGVVIIGQYLLYTIHSVEYTVKLQFTAWVAIFSVDLPLDLDDLYVSMLVPHQRD